MSKILSAILAFLISILPSSCSFIDRELAEDDMLAEEYMNVVAEALKSKDKDEIKELFSDKSIRLIDNIDNDIENLLNYIEGDVISWGNQRNVSGFERESGKDKKSISVDFILKTDKGKYLVFFEGNITNEIEPDDIGFYNLTILKPENKEKMDINWQWCLKPGIYVFTGDESVFRYDSEPDIYNFDD